MTFNCSCPCHGTCHLCGRLVVAGRDHTNCLDWVDKDNDPKIYKIEPRKPWHPSRGEIANG